MKQEILSEFLLAQTGLEDIVPESEFCKMATAGMKPAKATKKVAGKKRPNHRSGGKEEDEGGKKLQRTTRKQRRVSDVRDGSGSETDREDLAEIETEVENPDETEDEQDSKTASEDESDSGESGDGFMVGARAVYRQLLKEDTARRAKALAAIESFCTAPLADDSGRSTSSSARKAHASSSSSGAVAAAPGSSAETLELAPDIMARALVAVLEERTAELVADTAERAAATKEMVQDVASVAAGVNRARNSAVAQESVVGNSGNGLVSFVQETTEQVRELREELARVRNAPKQPSTLS